MTILIKILIIFGEKKIIVLWNLCRTFFRSICGPARRRQNSENRRASSQPLILFDLQANLLMNYLDFNINQIWRAWCQTIGKWGRESQFLCQFQEIFIEKSKLVLNKSVKIMPEVKAKVTKVMKLYFSQNNREPSKNITLCKYFLSKNPKIWVIVQNT